MGRGIAIVEYGYIIKLMKYFLVTFLILFLLGVAFGFTLMNHDVNLHSANAVPNCAIPLLDGVICTGDIVGMTMHHISAFQSFLQFKLSSFETNLLAFLILLMLLALAGIFWTVSNTTTLFKSFKFRTILHRANYKTLRWLSLFENSPSSPL